MRERKFPGVAGWAFLFFIGPFLFYGVYLNRAATAIDLPSLYWAAELAFHEHQSPYTRDAFVHVEQGEVDPAYVGQHVWPYLYPPPSLLAFYPLTLFKYGTAKHLMLFANAGFALVLLYLMLRLLDEQNVPRRWKGVAAAVLIVYYFECNGLMGNLDNGQVNVPLTILCTLPWFGVKRGWKSWVIALPLSLAIVVKLYAILLLPLLWARRKYAATAWTLGLLALYTAAAWAALPREAWADWRNNIVPTGGYGRIVFNLWSPAVPGNHSFNGLFTRIFTPNDRAEVLYPSPALGRRLTYVACAGLAGATLLGAWLTSRRRKHAGTFGAGTAANGDGGAPVELADDSRGPARTALEPDRDDDPRDAERADLQFSLFTLMIFLVAPLSWDHHVIYLIPAGVVLVTRAFRRSRRPWVRATLAVSVCLLAWPMPFQDAPFKRGFLMLAASSKTYAAAAMWGYCFYALVRHYGRAAASAPARWRPPIALPGPPRLPAVEV